MAVHPEAADPVVGAEPKYGEQGGGVLQAESVQLCQGVGRFILPMAVAVVLANLIG